MPTYILPRICPDAKKCRVACCHRFTHERKFSVGERGVCVAIPGQKAYEYEPCWYEAPVWQNTLKDIKVVEYEPLKKAIDDMTAQIRQKVEMAEAHIIKAKLATGYVERELEKALKELKKI